MTYFQFFLYSFIFLYIIYFTFIINKLLFNYERNLLFKRFAELWSIYIYSKENSFQTLYKQEIAVLYTSKTTNMDKKETLNKLEKKFINRTVEMCGKNVLADLSKMFGSTDSIILDLSEFYASQIIDLESGAFEMESPDYVDMLNGDTSTKRKKTTRKSKLDIF